MNRHFLPYSAQSISEEDIRAVSNVLKGEFLTTGPAVGTFEAGLRAATGAPYVAACANGTAALHLALMALGIGPEDAVVVPAITFLATANAARYVGAEVVFADVDPESGLMEAAHVRSAIERASRPVRVVMPVHLNGQCANLGAIKAVADEIGADVVEDACHAIGGAFAGDPVGSNRFSTMATFSFHPAKTIACGEGGAVSTADENLFDRLCLLRNHGMDRNPDTFTSTEIAVDRNGEPNPWFYEMREVGYNYRLSDIHAALGASQLERLSAFVERRRCLTRLYEDLIAEMSLPVRCVTRAPDNDPAWHLMAVLIEFDRLGVDRATVMRRLKERGIGTQVHYIPVPLQPYYRELSGETGRNYLVGALAYYDRCLSLPLFSSMSDDDVRRVCETLSAVLTESA